MDLLHSFTLGDLVREHRRSHPHRCAVVSADGERFTFEELDRRVNRLAQALWADGVRQGDRVLWLAQSSHRTLEVVLAAAKLGAMACPANWRQTAAEMAFVIDDLDPAVVFWQEEEIGDVVRAARELSSAGASERAHPGGPPWYRHDAPADASDSYEALLARGDDVDPMIDVEPFWPVLVIYTAAFSGQPNGAMMSHLGFLIENLMIANLQRVDHETVFLNSGPLFHIGNWMTTMATFLYAGTNVFERRFDPEEFCALVEREGITSAYVVGPMQDRILEANADGRWNLKSLRSGPGSDAWNAMVTVRETPWTASPGGFGQTEVNGLCTWRSIGGVGEGSHGRPFPFVQLAILDEDGRELPPGSVGEIGVRGPTVMVGYHDRAEENARRRRGGWHHTHDLGRREPDGSLTFVGPKTTMIKSGVENIYPAEVEAAIRRHPAVADVCVIGVPDPQWDQSVKAVVVLRDGDSATEDEIIAHTRSLIASYKKPRAVVFVASLPRDASGFAVDRAAVDAAHGGGGYPGPSRLRG